MARSLSLLFPLAALAAMAAMAACTEDNTAPNTRDMAQQAVPRSDLPAFFNCLDEAEKTIVSAHRGGHSAGYPENSLITFKHMAEENGVFLLEVDIQTSADGVLYLFHDDELKWKTNGDGMAAELSWSELRALSLKDDNRELTPYRLSTLQEVLEWADGKAILQLDIKRTTKYDDVALAVQQAGASERVIPIAYTANQALALARKFPKSLISVPVGSQDDLHTLERRGLPRERIIAWGGIEELNPSLYGYLDQQNIEVAFGTLGGRSSIDKTIVQSGQEQKYSDIADQNVDIIATDRPLAAKAQLMKSGHWPLPGTCSL